MEIESVDPSGEIHLIVSGLELSVLTHALEFIDKVDSSFETGVTVIQHERFKNE